MQNVFPHFLHAFQAHLCWLHSVEARDKQHVDEEGVAASSGTNPHRLETLALRRWFVLWPSKKDTHFLEDACAVAALARR